MPSISTRHMRHAPTGAPSFGLVTEVRDLDVALLGGVDQHHSLGRADLAAVDRQLDDVLFGRGIERGQCDQCTGIGAGVLVGDPDRDHVLQLRPLGALARRLDLVLELAPELLDHRADRHRHRVAQNAQAVADDLLLDGRHDVEIHRGCLARLDPLEHLDRPVGALAARHALAARLVRVELGQLDRDLEHGVRVVDDDDRARAEHRARLGHRVEVVRDVEVVLGQHRRARAAGEPELDLAAFGRSAGEPVDELARRDPELDLVVAGPLHVARDRHELRAGRGLGAELGVLLAAHPDDRRARSRASRRC